jgi:hypothetical protein
LSEGGAAASDNKKYDQSGQKAFYHDTISIRFRMHTSSPYQSEISAKSLQQTRKTPCPPEETINDTNLHNNLCSVDIHFNQSKIAAS